MKIRPSLFLPLACILLLSGSVFASNFPLNSMENAVSQLLPVHHSFAKGLPGEEGVAAMGVGSELFSTDDTAAKGNVVSVNRPVSLESISVYLENVPAGTTIEWALYSGETIGGDYHQITAVSQEFSGGSGDFESPALGAVLQPGKFYWIGAYWSQTVTYFFSNTLPGAPLTFDLGFGRVTYHGRVQTYSTLPGPATISVSSSSVAPYRLSYRFRAVENAGLGEASGDSGTATNSKGNVITVDEKMTLQSIAPYLGNVPADMGLYWAVYRSPTIDGSYQKVWEATGTVTGGNGYFQSPPAMVTLEAGWYYWLGARWDQDATYYFSNTQPAAPLDFSLGFGQLTYRGRDGDRFDTIPGPPSFTGYPASSVAPYQQRYTLRPGAAVTLGEGTGAPATDADASKGNIVSVSETETLEAIELYLEGVGDGTTVSWAVYQSDTIDGTYTKIREVSRNLTESAGYFSSGPLMVTLEPGKFYWIGGFWSQPVTYFYSSSQAAPVTFPIGKASMTFRGRLGAYDSLPAPETFSAGTAATSGPYVQRYIFSGSQTSIFYDTMETGDLGAWTEVSP